MIIYKIRLHRKLGVNNLSITFTSNIMKNLDIQGVQDQIFQKELAITLLQLKIDKKFLARIWSHEPTFLVAKS